MAFWSKRPTSRIGTRDAPASPDADSPDEASPSLLAEERGIPPVNPRAYTPRGQLALIGIGLLGLLVLMWLTNRAPNTSDLAANDPSVTKTQRFDDATPNNGDLAPAAVTPPPAIAPFEPPKPPTPVGTRIEIVPSIEGSAPPAGSAPTQHPLTPLEKRMRSKTTIQGALAAEPAIAASTAPHAGPGLPMFAADGTQITEASATGQPPAEGPYSATPGAIGGFSPPNVQPIALPASAGLEDGSVNDYLRPTKLAGVAAGRIPDRRLMVAKGKMIDCVLDTAISTVVAGMVRCTMTRDIYGEDGKAVLLDRGTEMTGEYRANLHTGQARLGIVWDRAKTPHGVLIELASPASDPLGRAGVDGFVDTHFWEKYGAAMLLSSLDDLLIIVTNNARNNQVFIPANSERAGRDAATTALEQDLRIPPTLIKNQGEHITIFVARDLDFRSVYAYRAPVRTAYE